MKAQELNSSTLPLRRFATLILLTIAGWTAHASSPQGQVSQERWFVYASLLNTQDSDLIKLAAKGIAREAVKDRRLTDMAARVLTEQMDGTRSINADTIAWLAKSLGASGSRRYSAVLERLVATKSGNVMEHATSALAQLTETAPVFAADSVDWKTVADEIISTANSNRQNSRLHAASIGTSIEAAIKMFGYPMSVGTVLRERRTSAGKISVNNVQFWYEGRGFVELEHFAGDWRSSLISPELLPNQRADEGTIVGQVRKGLVGDDVNEFRQVSTLLLDQKLFDATTLDLAAWRLQSHYQTTDEILVDGLAQICVAFGETGNARYRRVLELAASSAASDKLKRQAKRALDDVPVRDVESFQGVF